MRRALRGVRMSVLGWSAALVVGCLVAAVLQRQFDNSSPLVLACFAVSIACASLLRLSLLGGRLGTPVAIAIG